MAEGDLRGYWRISASASDSVLSWSRMVRLSKQSPAPPSAQSCVSQLYPLQAPSSVPSHMREVSTAWKQNKASTRKHFVFGKWVLKFLRGFKEEVISNQRVKKNNKTKNQHK